MIPKTKTVLDYIAVGGIVGKHFHNTTYDPQNPIYEVKGVRMLGDADTPDGGMLTIDCDFLPEGSPSSRAIVRHINDKEAGYGEVRELLRSQLEKLGLKRLAEKKVSSH